MYNRWGGLLAVIASAEDFDKVRAEDPEISWMITTMKQLEASLQDLVEHGPQKFIDTFISCQLTPQILNRWNSPVLDALWQAVTGRTPDGVTPFAANPPHRAAALVNRLVWPRAYPEAVDLVLRVIRMPDDPSMLLAPAIVTAARAGHVVILKQLLVYPLSLAANDYLCRRLPNIAACGHVPCCDEIFPRLMEYGVRQKFDAVVAQILRHRAWMGHLTLVKFLLSHYTFELRVLEAAAEMAARCVQKDEADATFALLFQHIPNPTVRMMTDSLCFAAAGNRVRVVEQILACGLDTEAHVDAATWAVRAPDSSVVFALLLNRLSPDARVQFFIMIARSEAHDITHETWHILLDSIRETPRREVQRGLDYVLCHSVMLARRDNVQLLLQHGAHARGADDYIIYLAAVSGRADVLDLLLGASDVDSECLAQYRQYLDLPGGLLTLAQLLHTRNAVRWTKVELDVDLFHERADALAAALCGGHLRALEWLLAPSTRCPLKHTWALSEAVRAGSTDVVRLVLQPQYREQLNMNSFSGLGKIVLALVAARQMKNLDLIKLLFSASVRQVSLNDVRAAVQADDPFTREYLFGHVEPCVQDNPDERHFKVGLLLLMEACMTGHLVLFQDVWRFALPSLSLVPRVFAALEPRINRALPLCAEGDLTPLMMVLMDDVNEAFTRYEFDKPDHVIMLAARCGHLPAVKLWLAAGIPAQMALHAAVKHDQREVIRHLIAHGAAPSKLGAANYALFQSLNL